MTYVIASPWLNRTLAVVTADSPLTLRRECRAVIGRRRSARMRYRQVGSHSFVVETKGGWPVLQVYAG